MLQRKKKGNFSKTAFFFDRDTVLTKFWAEKKPRLMVPPFHTMRDYWLLQKMNKEFMETRDIPKGMIMPVPKVEGEESVKRRMDEENKFYFKMQDLGLGGRHEVLQAWKFRKFLNKDPDFDREIGRKIGRAFGFLHRHIDANDAELHFVVRRDSKGEVRARDVTPYVLDFGMSRTLEEAGEKYHREGELTDLLASTIYFQLVNARPKKDSPLLEGLREGYLELNPERRDVIESFERYVKKRGFPLRKLQF